MDEPPSKKPRFDPRNPSTLVAEVESDDENLEAGDVGKSRGVKRGAVKVDGYDSDSSTENFNTRAEAKAAATLQDDDEDDDMFAGSDKDERKPSRKDKKKPVRFLETHEIEGQEETSKSGGHVAADLAAGVDSHTNDVETSSESGDDEERARLDSDVDEEIGAGGKKKHAPKLDAFNMRKEQEEGRFDESGNYVRRARDPEADQDNWLDGISKKDVKKAREAHEKREAEQKEQRRAIDAIVTSDVLTTLIPLLERAETPMEALSRYNKVRPQQPKKRHKWDKNKKSGTMDVDEDPDKQAAAERATKAINDITESVSALEKKGMDDVYDIPREMLVREYRNDTGEDWKEPVQKAEDPDTQWELRYDASPDVVHSPFPTSYMIAWKEQGHFDNGAEFRRVGETEWTRIPNFTE